MALMAGYTPIASAMMAVLVPIFEPLGLSKAEPDTLLGFDYTPRVRPPILFPSHHCFAILLLKPTGRVLEALNRGSVRKQWRYLQFLHIADA